MRGLEHERAARIRRTDPDGRDGTLHAAHRGVGAIPAPRLA